MLEQALSVLLETIDKNGEYEKYCDMLADKEDEQRKDMRRMERERRKLEEGDAYEDSDYDDEDEDEDEYDSNSLTFENSDDLYNSEEDGGDVSRAVSAQGSKRGAMSNAGDFEEPFNALRFLALQLKELNEKPKSVKG